MTTSQIILITGLYLGALVAVAYLTRTKVRRIVGAVAGGAVFGVVALLAVALGEDRSWWQVPKANSSHFPLLFWFSFSVSCAPVYLITWRVARRFGGRGLAVCVLAAAIIGPPRDYWFAATFPAWIVFSAGIAPVLAAATIYALLVVVGHTVMRLFVGPAEGDSLARRRSGEDGTADTSAQGSR
jgi:hypothetical protein